MTLEKERKIPPISWKMVVFWAGDQEGVYLYIFNTECYRVILDVFSCSFRYFRCPADSSELAYDPPAVMNADTLSYCQKEAWCKLAFYLLSFFYYLYW